MFLSNLNLTSQRYLSTCIVENILRPARSGCIVVLEDQSHKYIAHVIQSHACMSHIYWFEHLIQHKHIYDSPFDQELKLTFQ